MEEASVEVDPLVANVACVAVDKPLAVVKASVVEPAVEPVVLLAVDSCSVDDDVVGTDELGTTDTDDVDVEYRDDTACGLVVSCSPDPLTLETTLLLLLLLASDVEITNDVPVDVPKLVAVAVAVTVADDSVEAPVVSEAVAVAKGVEVAAPVLVPPNVASVASVAVAYCSVDDDVVDMDELGSTDTDEVDVEYRDDTACWLVVCSPDPLRLTLETTLVSDAAAAVDE